MHTLIAQYDKHNGPDAVSQHKLSFTIDERNQEEMYKFLATVKKGTEIMLILLKTTDEDGNIKEEITEMINETEKETRARLFRQMHAIISDIAKNKKIEPDTVKKSLKDFLINKNYIKSSSKELDLGGLAAGIYYLKNNYDY